jgi:hypothetical protein
MNFTYNVNMLSYFLSVFDLKDTFFWEKHFTISQLVFVV